jgi:hypothetical protein
VILATDARGSAEETVKAEVVHLSEEERRQRARQAILEAFAERPLKLIEGEVIESETPEKIEDGAESDGYGVGKSSDATS